VSVRLGFLSCQDLFLMNAAIGVMVIDAQQSGAIWKLAPSALSRYFQFFCHGFLWRAFARISIRRTDIPGRQEPNFKFHYITVSPESLIHSPGKRRIRGVFIARSVLFANRKLPFLVLKAVYGTFSTFLRYG
jgi:hypothetical protein